MFIVFGRKSHLKHLIVTVVRGEAAGVVFVVGKQSVRQIPGNRVVAMRIAGVLSHIRAGSAPGSAPAAVK